MIPSRLLCSMLTSMVLSLPIISATEMMIVLGNPSDFRKHTRVLFPVHGTGMQITPRTDQRQPKFSQIASEKAHSHDDRRAIRLHARAMHPKWNMSFMTLGDWQPPPSCQRHRPIQLALLVCKLQRCSKRLPDVYVYVRAVCGCQIMRAYVWCCVLHAVDDPYVADSTSER